MLFRSGMLAPKFREVSLGELQVRQVYKIPDAVTVGSILGIARGVGALRHIGAVAATAAAIARATAIPVTTALAASMIAAAAAIAVAVMTSAGSAGTCICALSHSVGVGGVDDHTAVTALALLSLRTPSILQMAEWMMRRS